ncbi:MAG: putative toxin-antitoxin system toxin component, PIN family [Candidatus Schekmanbacteria bacterium RBG_16_38_10]|uniref:Putative toxin-antitoxin system toxin component, PIN family n=1 Tax=Candidatus Schekmanbacteria bacterium RBG_16_38_10 TaxID=1817879 RepID=A0A1F7RSD1_9BACT|nr:MAG: putative toxin-antitoxin system toxin component, PIN family [Candidatus Schekmanbacteria bacterium RBG_16_38_10]
MNIVLDTNVLVAGLLSPFGACGEIVRMVSSGELVLSFDARVLSEYNEVLRRQKFKFEEEKVAVLLEYIEYRGQTAASSPLINPLPDADDEPFLETAIASQAVCLVTGNQNYFPAELCQGIKVFSPKKFLIFYKKQKRQKKYRMTKYSGR